MKKRFNDDDIIPEGWTLGRLKSPITTQGCIWINNGREAKFIDKMIQFQMVGKRDDLNHI